LLEGIQKCRVVRVVDVIHVQSDDVRTFSLSAVRPSHCEEAGSTLSRPTDPVLNSICGRKPG